MNARNMNRPRRCAQCRAQVGVVLTVGVCFLVAFASPTDAQWIADGPYTKDIRAVAEVPGSPGMFVCGAFGWGVFVTTSSVTPWVNHTDGLTNTYVRSVAARSAGVMICGTNDNIARSTDSGATWTVVQPTAFSVRALAYDPSTGHWFAGTYGDDFYRSTDDGVTWVKHIITDPGTGETLHRIRALVRFGADSLYAGGSISDITAGGALFVSHNGGMNWTQVQQAIGVRSSVTSISISPNVPATSLIFGTAIKGMYKSTNGGSTILGIDAESTPNPLPDTSVSSTAFTPTFRLAGTDVNCGVYLRALGDTTNGWETAAGLPGTPAGVNALTHFAGGSGLMAGLEEAGTYRSLDSGRHFSAAHAGLMETDVRRLEFSSSGRMAAATGFGDRILYSDNSGTSWQHADVQSANSFFDLAHSSTGVYFAAQYGEGVLMSTDLSVWLLTDTLVINRFVRSVETDPFNSNTVYAGTGEGVFKTTNQGVSWASVNQGTIPAATSIHSLGTSRFVSGVVLAGSDSSFLYRSSNGGSTWTHLDSTNGFRPLDRFIRTIRFDPVRSGYVYAGSENGHIYRSTNNGSTWTFLVNLPGGGSVREVAIDTALATRIFAATYGSGVFVSEDDGLHWHSYNESLPDLSLSTVTIRPGSSPLNLWIGTAHRGAFHRTYTGLPSNVKPALQGPSQYSVAGGGAVFIQYTATDANLADTLSFTKTGPGVLTAPPGFSPQTATLNWTTVPADTLGSPYLVRVVVSDGYGLTDTVSTSITVTNGSAFVRGDVNANGNITSSDIIYLVNYTFKAGAPPQPVVAAGDVNCSGTVTSSDIIYLVNYVFKGGPGPCP